MGVRCGLLLWFIRVRSRRSGRGEAPSLILASLLRGSEGSSPYATSCGSRRLQAATVPPLDLTLET